VKLTHPAAEETHVKLAPEQGLCPNRLPLGPPIRHFRGSLEQPIPSSSSTASDHRHPSGTREIETLSVQGH
jgi:hypothetical protein